MIRVILGHRNAFASKLISIKHNNQMNCFQYQKHVLHTKLDVSNRSDLLP